MTTLTTVGQALRRLREDAGLTQLDAARRAGIAKNSLSAWERGRTAPQLEKLLAYLEILAVDLRDLGDAVAEEMGHPRTAPSTPAEPAPSAAEPPARPRWSPELSLLQDQITDLRREVGELRRSLGGGRPGRGP
ncbi:MAG: helix-turn-helix transcriptional regulator [Acidobacteriota bacterium]